MGNLSILNLEGVIIPRNNTDTIDYDEEGEINSSFKL